MRELLDRPRRGLSQMILRLRTVASSVILVACASHAAIGQAPTQTGQYPMNDIAVTLASGTVIRIRNAVVVRIQNVSGLAVYIETPTPSTERERVALEAKEVAGFELKAPAFGNLASVTVIVCRTNGCLELREKSPETFSFVRKPDGSLKAEEQPGTAVQDADASLMRITYFLVGEWREPACGTKPVEGERILFPGGDYCEWMTPTRGRIVAQRDEQHHVHAVILNRQTDGEANARVILDSLATTLRSFGLSERECEPGSSPAGAIRSWLYEDRTGVLVHISEVTPPASQPRLLGLAVDIPGELPRALCH
jgi:hypothetical protein